MSSLDRFSPATRAWFTGAFQGPTPAQEGAWDAISAGSNTLVVAPTGSGKTLSAFLWSLDRLAATPPPEDPLARCRVRTSRNSRSRSTMTVAGAPITGTRRGGGGEALRVDVIVRQQQQ